jgi:hypothetical protein
MEKPTDAELSDYFLRYVSQVKETNLLNALIDQQNEFISFLKLLPADKENFRYAEEKWTLKELIQHIIDTERVFEYRALCFARHHDIPQPGFDQDLFVNNSNAANRQMKDLIEEFLAVRMSTIALYKSFNEEQMQRKGIASDRESTPLILGFAIVGHCTHHHKIIIEKYL